MKKSKTPEGPFAGLRELRDKLAREEEAAAKAPARPPAVRPRPAPSASATRPSSDEDDTLAFHRMVSGVTPLSKDGHARISRIPGEASGAARPVRTQAAAALESDAVHEHLRVLVEGGTRFEVSDDGRHVEGRRVDVPPEWLRKLRRGLLPIDAQVDLHGLRAGDARAELEAFLRRAREKGERCVLVVHGKGEHSPGGVGVLRGEIAAWLSQGTSSVHVGAFASAHREDGGEGAVYVLLRR